MMTRSARPFEMPIAMDSGLVSYEVPSLTDPSGSVIWMGLRSFSGETVKVFQNLT